MKELPAHKPREAGNDIYGQARLELGELVKLALGRTEAVWFLDGGTLLGAYRSESLIPHDDDFDTAVYLPSYCGERDLLHLKRLMEPFLPTPYVMRVVTSYAKKLEVYDPTSRCFLLPNPYYKGADFHMVTVDVQVMTDAADGCVIYLHDLLKHVKVPKDTISPTGEITCEGIVFNCPHDVERFLEAQYGYLGADARFDPETKMYVKSTT